MEVGPGHSPQAREEEGLEKQLLEQGTPGAPHIHKKDQRECTRGMNIMDKRSGRRNRLSWDHKGKKKENSGKMFRKIPHYPFEMTEKLTQFSELQNS